jgi:hypothetical protein
VVKLLMNILTRKFEFEAGMYTISCFLPDFPMLTQVRCLLPQAWLLR